MEYVYLGKIVNTFGIKGEVKVISDFEYDFVSKHLKRRLLYQIIAITAHVRFSRMKYTGLMVLYFFMFFPPEFVARYVISLFL